MDEYCLHVSSARVGGGGGGRGEQRTYQAFKLNLEGYAGDGNRLGLVVGPVALRLDGGEHEEGAVAGEDVCYEALVGI